MKTTPAYNLNVVIRETGLKPDTLRAWERRYGLPKPTRTEGGHRLYSERDIATIQWLIDRQREGLRIKQAVNLWKEYEQSGQNPFDERQPGSPKSSFNGSPEIIDLITRWVQACYIFDEQSVVEITNYAFALYPLETVCFDILLAGLAEIGEAWYQGKASVQQEHFASVQVIRRLDSLISAAPSPTKKGSILIGCPPEEDHIISSLVLTLLLRQNGWDVVYLGANVPQIRLDETIKAIKPRLVVMSAQHLDSAASLIDIGNRLVEMGILFAFGGQIFVNNPGLSDRIPGHYLGDQLKKSIPVIEKLISKDPNLPLILNPKPSLEKALNYFQTIQPRFDYQVSQILLDKQISPEQLETINQYFSKKIVSGLKLGNLAYIQNELHWIQNLPKEYGFDSQLLKDFISAYYEIASSMFDDRGNIILEWFFQLKQFESSQ